MVEFRGSGVNSVGRLSCDGFAKIDGRCDSPTSWALSTAMIGRMVLKCVQRGQCEQYER